MTKVLVAGSVALDSVETSAGQANDVLGGAATFGSVAAALFGPVSLVGVVGDDFPQVHVDFLQTRGIDLQGLCVIEGGKTFRWKGDYNEDLNQAVTHETRLGVFEHWAPELPEALRDADFVLLGNINPDVQLAILQQVRKPQMVLCDTMNLWINIARDQVLEVFRRVDVAVLNDAEARLLTGATSVIRAGRQLLELGPQAVIIKKGEHGALMFSQDAIFAAPGYPLEDVIDPTGAGDSFAGAFLGYLAKSGSMEPQNIRRAVVYGSVVASTTVQDFSVKALAALTPEVLEERYSTIKAMSTF